MHKKSLLLLSQYQWEDDVLQSSYANNTGMLKWKLAKLLLL